MFNVTKRDGQIVDFELSKIGNAIKKAFDSQHQVYTDAIINLLALQVTSDFQKKVKNNTITVEDIQDSVEHVLIQANYGDVAKAYILYRKQRERIRNLKATTLDYRDVIEGYTKVEDWRVKENSTVTYSIGGLILSNSGAVTANYWLSEIYDQEIADAHRNADIHIHDLSMLTGYCAGWSLKQLIQEGLGGIQGKITSSPAKHLSVLCNQMVNFLGILQNEWAGAQAFSSFDTYLAPFVKVDNLSYPEVKKCIESFIYGVNIPSRWGCVDTETEVLSTEGFKKYNELKEGDLIYTWNNGGLELNPVRKVIVKPFKGQLYGYHTLGYEQNVTPNHRMLVRDHGESEFYIDLSEDVFDRMATGQKIDLPVAFDSINLDTQKQALSAFQVILAALYYGHGKNKSDKLTIKIPVTTDHMVVEKSIQQALNSNRMRYVATFVQSGNTQKLDKQKITLFDDDAARFRMLFGDTNDIIDAIFKLPSDHIELFIKTWSGEAQTPDEYVCKYKTEHIKDQLQHLALLMGKCSYVQDNCVIIRKNENYVIPDRINMTDYDGEVWCPNVKNGTAVFRKNGCVYISGQTQAPFSNVTLDWTVPEDLAELPAIVGGKEMDFKYKDCKPEMDMINKAFIEIMIEGDANGRGFQYPMKESWPSVVTC